MRVEERQGPGGVEGDSCSLSMSRHFAAGFKQLPEGTQEKELLVSTALSLEARSSSWTPLHNFGDSTPPHIAFVGQRASLQHDCPGNVILPRHGPCTRDHQRQEAQHLGISILARSGPDGCLGCGCVCVATEEL